MESDECICQNYYLRLLENALNSILRTTGNVMMNSNTPATDSGYIFNSGTTNSINTLNTPSGNGNGNDSSNFLQTGFYSILIVTALMLLLMGMRKKGSKLN
jgi:hypothetical protein